MQILYLCPIFEQGITALVSIQHLHHLSAACGQVVVTSSVVQLTTVFPTRGSLRCFAKFRRNSTDAILATSTLGYPPLFRCIAPLCSSTSSAKRFAKVDARKRVLWSNLDVPLFVSMKMWAGKHGAAQPRRVTTLLGLSTSFSLKPAALLVLALVKTSSQACKVSISRQGDRYFAVKLQRRKSSRARSNRLIAVAVLVSWCLLPSLQPATRLLGPSQPFVFVWLRS